MEGKFKTIAGSVWYKVYGENNDNIPLIVLHGGPGAPHNYLLPLSELAYQRKVIFYDQLGCGKSDKVEDKSVLTLDYFVQELFSLLVVLNLEKVHLLGQSWGTMIAVAFASQYPNFVKTLILSSPFLKSELFAKDVRSLIYQLDEYDRNAIIKYEELKDYGSEEYQKAMGSFYSKFVCRLNPYPDFINDSFSNLATDVYNTLWGPSEFTITGTLSNADVTDLIEKINCPVLITAGEFDEVKTETVMFYSKLFNDSRVSIIKDASHLHNAEQTELYNNLVSNFIHNYDCAEVL